MTNTSVLLSARLTGAESLSVFRAVLDALARPGSIVELPAGAAMSVPPAVVPVLALADLDVSVAVLESNDDAEWATSIRSVTGCQLAAPADADMVVALRLPDPGEVTSCRAGTAHTPERGARLFVRCLAVSDGQIGPGVTVRVRGPGASAGRTFTVGGVSAEVLSAVATATRAFPAGVDTWLIADDRRMVAVPRSSHIEILATADHQGSR